MSGLVLLRGGGDLASGVALRLVRSGLKVVVSELPQPLAIRRTVSFAEAVYAGQCNVEGVHARLVKRDQILLTLDAGEVPVMVDPEASILLDADLTFSVVVDARLTKQAPATLPTSVPLHIGLGPGFHAGENCHAVIETRRSHSLGRVYWSGSAQADSAQPEGDPRRVLRSPAAGVVIGHIQIGEHVEAGDTIAVIGDQVPVTSLLSGVLRGLIHDGLNVPQGLKIGDVDPRDDASACWLVSDKALAIGGGVLEAILTRADIRQKIW